MELAQLFNLYGSDKDVNGYTPLYSTLFRARRQDPVALLEVGIGTMIQGVHSSMVGYAAPHYRPGGSLRAWRDYFPLGEITGMDVQPDTQFSDEPRIRTTLSSSYDAKTVADVLGPPQPTFDFIIDDGSHNADNQLATLGVLLPYLKLDGTYIIEDIYPGSAVSEDLARTRALFPNTIQFLVGKRSNQLVITYA